MRRTNHIASKAALSALLASALLLCPLPALATSGSAQSGTGTTEVTVQAGPGWDQIVQTSTVGAQARRGGGLLANTGERSLWPSVLLMGAAACCTALLLGGTRRGDGERGDDTHAQ